ncbi:hypothetical protein BU16DRAFT_600092 [Lophium mytilinum]|uniref:RING-type domain-containing protein n=1 Tax=Lophium mytilinum TaxID=390894 RepID=A0A6A6RAP6_9PEZI|nr:hypothetical protein BU16DRAFT_600092 [Lophium mytilinum]
MPLNSLHCSKAEYISLRILCQHRYQLSTRSLDTNTLSSFPYSIPTSTQHSLQTESTIPLQLQQTTIMEHSSHTPSARSFPSVLATFERIANATEIGYGAPAVEYWIRQIGRHTDLRLTPGQLAIDPEEYLAGLTNLARRSLEMDYERMESEIPHNMYMLLRGDCAQIALKIAHLTGDYPSEDGALPAWTRGNSRESLDPFVDAAVKAAAYEVLPSEEQRAEYEIARVRGPALRWADLPWELHPDDPAMPALPSMVAALQGLADPQQTAEQVFALKQWLYHVARSFSRGVGNNWRERPDLDAEAYVEQIVFEVQLELQKAVRYGNVLPGVRDRIDVREVVLAIGQLQSEYRDHDGHGISEADRIANVASWALIESAVMTLPSLEDQLRFYEELPEVLLNPYDDNNDQEWEAIETAERADEMGKEYLEKYTVPIEGALPQDVDECPICTLALEAGVEGDDEPVKTRCLHFFHVACLTHWIVSRMDNSEKCPMCRRPMQE